MKGKLDYTVIAPIYDQLMMTSNKYSKWKKLIGNVMDAYSVEMGSALDLCCGTGTISNMLVDYGFKRVIGIDNSDAMIAVARSKEIKADFQLKDARTFSLSRQRFNFVVSFYDSLNYMLTDEDMYKVFSSVCSCLKQGGIFLFDMNTRAHVFASQRNSPRQFDISDIRANFRFKGKGRFWVLDLEFSKKDETGEYQPLGRERHVERGYNEADILPLLWKAHLKPLETRCVYKQYEDGQTHPSRLYFIAKKA